MRRYNQNIVTEGVTKRMFATKNLERGGNGLPTLENTKTLRQRLDRLLKENRKLHREISKYQSENHNLKREIEDWKTDLSYYRD